MNRTIKFRAYDITSKEFINDYEVYINQKGETYWEHYERGMQEEVDIEINIFTGLKDKNGTEIYEGDIVEVDREKSVIESVPGGFTVARLPLVEVSNYGMKVIGNIHENPELLERSE